MIRKKRERKYYERKEVRGRTDGRRRKMKRRKEGGKRRRMTVKRKGRKERIKQRYGTANYED